MMYNPLVTMMALGPDYSSFRELPNVTLSS